MGNSIIKTLGLRRVRIEVSMQQPHPSLKASFPGEEVPFGLAKEV